MTNEQEKPQGEGASEEVDLDALLAELGGGDASPAPAQPAEEQPAAEPDLDALLAELGGGEPARDAPESAPAEAPADDLDALLAELSAGQDNPQENPPSAGAEPSAAADANASGGTEADLDALLKELDASAPSADVSESNANAAPARPPRAPREKPTRTFDADDEPQKSGPRWDRFAPKDRASPSPKSRPKPWRKSSEDTTEGGSSQQAGWGKLHKPGGGSEPSDPGESPRPGWDKFRK